MGADMILAFAKDGKEDTDLIVKPYTWAQLVNRLSQVAVGEKDGSYLIRGGKLKNPHRANDNLMEAELLVIDGDSSFDPETGESFTGVDEGEPDPKRRIKGNCVPIDVARDALTKLGYRYIIHTTHTHTPGVLNKWRAFIPTKMRSKEELEACVDFVIAQLHAKGCYVEPNKESKVWAQPWYLPRCKQKYRDAFRCYASLHGRDVDVAAAVKAAAAHKKAEMAISEASKPLATGAQLGAYDGDGPIDIFNRVATFSAMRHMLESAGYKFAGKRGEMWRFIAPGSRSGVPGVNVFKGAKHGDLVTYSWHDAHDPLSHRLTDAFGLLTLLRHGGNQDAALEEAKKAIGWKPGRKDLDGFEVEEIMAEDFPKATGDNGDNGDSGPKRRLEVLSLIDLMDDESPDEPNYVEPDFLGPGNFCLVAGPPKAQKSFFVMELLLACATGGKFLDGLFSVPRPLKVFYLQAEMGRRLLKKRAKMASMISSEERRLIEENFAVTSRISMRLDDKGVKEVVAAIKARFPDGGPDIIAIDPLANVFDGESEDKAPEVMKFLTQRVEAIRHRVNPAAGVVMVHHSGKRAADVMAADPFSSIRGSGALRGYYDTGVVIYRRSEESPDRRIHFELREGESPEPVTARLSRYGTFEVIDTSLGAISRSMAKDMLEEIDRRWKDNKPLAKSHVAGERYAARYLARKFEVPAEAVKKLVEAWLDNEIVEDCELGGRSTRRGLKKVANID